MGGLGWWYPQKLNQVSSLADWQQQQMVAVDLRPPPVPLLPPQSQGDGPGSSGTSSSFTLTRLRPKQSTHGEQ